MVAKRLLVLVDVGVFPSGTAVLSFLAGNNVAMTTAGTNAQGVSNTTTAAGSSLVMSFSSAVTRVESLEIRKDQLPTGCRWAQPIISVSSAAAPVFGVIVLGGEGDYKPIQQFESTCYATGTTGVAARDQLVIT